MTGVVGLLVASEGRFGESISWCMSGSRVAGCLLYTLLLRFVFTMPSRGDCVPDCGERVPDCGLTCAGSALGMA